MSTTSASPAKISLGDSASMKSSSQTTSHNVSNSPTAANENRPPEIATDDRTEVGERQLRALELIVSGATDTAVAEAVGVNRRTIYRWRTEDEGFRAQLQRRRAELYAQNTDRMRSMLSDALGTLHRQVNNSYAPTAHRAARTLLALSRIGNAVVCPDPDAPRVMQPRADAPANARRVENESGVEK